MRKTNPMAVEVSSLKGEVSSEEGSAAGVPTSNFTLETSNSAEGRACETNPIWSEAKEGQVLDEKGVMSDYART